MNVIGKINFELSIARLIQKSVLVSILFWNVASVTAATFTVTTLAGDNSVGSIRWACDQANANAGHDIVVFDAGLGASPTINLTTNLFITESIEIQGNTATGGIVQINGGPADGITMSPTVVSGSQTVFRGLSIQNFTNKAIYVENSQNVLIEDCEIGGNQEGVHFVNSSNVTISNNDISENTNEAILINNTSNITVTANTLYGNTKGVDISNNSSDITIEGNFIGDCNFEAIHMNSSSNVTVIDNVIGFLVDGVTPSTVGGDGVKVEATNNVTIGGSAATGNTISNSKNGIWMGSGSQNVDVINNYIGTDVLGNSAGGNNDHSVRIDDVQTANIDDNIISGSTNSYGVFIESAGWWGSNQSGVIIQNNTIGLDANGVVSPNKSGIFLSDPVTRNYAPVQILNNTIEGNNEHGIEIKTTTVANIIRGNTIQNNGQSGIDLTTASNNQIGGTGVGQGNVISDNSGNGVALETTSRSNMIAGNTIERNVNGVFVNDANSNQNRITQNSLSCNSIKGINLNGTATVGVGNSNKVAPTIRSSSSIGNLYGTATSGDQIEIYERGDCQTNGTCSASGYKMQGKTYVATVTASGTGEWSFASTLPSDNYTVVAISANGNTSESAVCSCTSPTFTVTGTDPTTCSGVDGALNLTPSGARPLEANATYNLTYNNPALVGPTEITTDGSGEYSITGLTAGTYSNVTLESFSCQTIGGGATLQDPATPVITTASTNPTTCLGTDGTITISGLISGSTYNVTYTNGSVVGPTALVANGSNQIVLTGLSAGSYTGIVVEINGCTSNIESETLSDPNAPVITTTSTDPTTCLGTDGTITIGGLVASTSYDISYTNGGVVGPTTLVANGSSQIILTGLNAGSYTGIVADLGGCLSNTETETLSDPATPVITTASTDPTTCSGTDGAITISGLVAGSSYDVSYSYGGLVGPTSLVANGSNQIVLSGLSEGNYSGIIADFSGCVSNVESEVLTDPSTPVITTTSINPTTCLGTDGSITISGLVVATSYNVSYMKGSLVGPTSLVANGSNQIVLNGLNAGAYTNIVAELSGCSSNPESESLSDPNAPVITTASTDPTTCLGTDGTITISGLVASTSYDVSYTNGSVVGPTIIVANGSNQIVLNGLNSGSYTGVSVDLDGCLSNSEAETLTDPLPVTISTTGTNPSNCNLSDGSITISNLLPTTNYTLNYTKNDVAISPLSITSDASGEFDVTLLSSAQYDNITVTSLGCESNVETEQLTDPGAPIITTSSLSPSTCLGTDGAITIQGLLPITNYNLVYNIDGVSVPSIGITSTNTGEFVVTSLSQGSYTGIQVDLSGCNSNVESEELLDPLSPTFTVSASPVSSCGLSDGVLTIGPSGANPLVPNGTYDVSYVDNEGIVLSSLGVLTNGGGVISFPNLSSGNYSNVIVTKDGCVTNDNEVYSINSPEIEPGTSLLSSEVICHDENSTLSLQNTTGTRLVWQESVLGSWEDISDTMSVAGVLPISRNSSEEPYLFRAVVIEGLCSGLSNEVSLQVDSCPSIFVPEGISINGDNINDLWVIQGLEQYDSFSIKVFNRWGNVVFESGAPYVPWDGKKDGVELPVATYYWHLEVFETGEKTSGPVTIIR